MQKNPSPLTPFLSKLYTLPNQWFSSPKSPWIVALAAAVGCCPVGAFAQTAFLNFNTVGQYTNNFNPWNDNGGGNGGNYCFMQSTTAGVNGGGGVSVFQSIDTTAVYNQGSWDFSSSGA